VFDAVGVVLTPVVVVAVPVVGIGVGVAVDEPVELTGGATTGAWYTDAAATVTLVKSTPYFALSSFNSCRKTAALAFSGMDPRRPSRFFCRDLI
jgi:hypothetical protein